MIGGACLILGRGEDEIKPERQTSEIQSLHVGKPTDRVRLPGSVRSVLFFPLPLTELLLMYTQQE